MINRIQRAYHLSPDGTDVRSHAGEQVATTYRLMSTRTANLFVVVTLVLLVGVSAGLAVANADGSFIGRVLVLSLIWTPIGVIICTRGLGGGDSLLPDVSFARNLPRYLWLPYPVDRLRLSWLAALDAQTKESEGHLS